MRFHVTNHRAILAGMAWLWLGLLIGSSSIVAQETQPSPASNEPAVSRATAAQIARWVDELGHPTYEVRQSAAEQLRAAGPAALEPLRKVIEGPDPETRAAARRIAAFIETTDFRRRLDAFAADVDGRTGLSLPGWDLFQKLVGGDAPARALFVEMQRQESAWFSMAFRDRPSNLGPSWEARLRQLSQMQAMGGRNASPQLASCATMFFLACTPGLEVSDQAVDSLVQLVYRSPFQEAMRGGNHRDAVRRLVSAWIIQCPNNSDSSLGQRMSVARTNDLSEAVPWGLSVAAGGGALGNVSSPTRASALLLVGQLGGREHVDRVEPLLEDSTFFLPVGVLGRRAGMAPGRDVQIRDVALIVLLQLTDQNPTDYGYPHAQRPQTQEMSAALMFPRTAEQREMAIAKWRSWKKTQPRESFNSDESPAAAAENSSANK